MLSGRLPEMEWRSLRVMECPSDMGSINALIPKFPDHEIAQRRALGVVKFDKSPYFPLIASCLSDSSFLVFVQNLCPTLIAPTCPH